MDGSQHIPARHTLFVSSIPPNLPPEEFAAPFQTIEDYLDARLTQDRNGEYVLFFFFSFPSFSTHPIRLVISFLVLVNGDGAHWHCFFSFQLFFFSLLWFFCFVLFCFVCLPQKKYQKTNKTKSSPLLVDSKPIPTLSLPFHSTVGFVDFASLQAATKAMESFNEYKFQDGDAGIQITFSRGGTKRSRPRIPGGGGGGGGAVSYQTLPLSFVVPANRTSPNPKKKKKKKPRSPCNKQLLTRQQTLHIIGTDGAGRSIRQDVSVH